MRRVMSHYANQPHILLGEAWMNRSQASSDHVHIVFYQATITKIPKRIDPEQSFNEHSAYNEIIRLY